ncbi:photosystem II cytochrome PsbV2 [Kovacikia minuta CCNUW1]|uniref:photosystem II cytochrome PsbV2 n=1 Tax=Kovacikia minuta TaxID=2931930 RepID=UPI001CC97FA6|nr:photosystem II cytochrome PsbV2 [Kovacikia minuta]UBF28478.1 photosystem II cytochrome PsbV2 [Kovacikia minuta CCNUW1]
MQYCFFWWVRLLVIVLVLCLSLGMVSPAAWADVDPYITRYLKVTEPINLEVDSQGQSRLFSPEELSAGKQLFENNCLNCHVGGATLPDPTVSLSLSDLKGATPPRNTINSLVGFFRQPMTYDGSEESNWCRQVPETWLTQEQVESLAGFVLRAAQTAPGWGSKLFDKLS